jgi:hypothetical protein
MVMEEHVLFTPKCQGTPIFLTFRGQGFFPFHWVDVITDSAPRATFNYICSIYLCSQSPHSSKDEEFMKGRAL